ncbi:MULTISPECIES: IS5 family transposase [unclassified Microcoleus]|uniref:IS5 family transposase n=1 Tax=unclassified Microcoleus TaxID=2642155 RepID=UPI004040A386
MKNQSYLNLKPCEFKRRFGVKIETLKAMVNALENFKSENQKDRRGRRTILTVEEQVLVALEYWREYRTYFHIGTSWGVSESTICRIVTDIESTLMKTGKFRIPGKKALLKDSDYPEFVVMDVTETAIERPQKKQKNYYSGKKKCHTLKTKLVINQETREIICTAFGQGSCHDFNLFKKSKTHFHPETNSLQDSGYQGIKNYHSNSYIPRKKPKNGKLSLLEKSYNRVLAQERIVIEHINRSLKIFKILSSRYRNRRRRYGLRCNLLSAIYNYELALGD